MRRRNSASDAVSAGLTPAFFQPSSINLSTKAGLAPLSFRAARATSSPARAGTTNSEATATRGIKRQAARWVKPIARWEIRTRRISMDWILISHSDVVQKRQITLVQVRLRRPGDNVAQRHTSLLF